MHRQNDTRSEMIGRPQNVAMKNCVACKTYCKTVTDCKHYACDSDYEPTFNYKSFLQKRYLTRSITRRMEKEKMDTNSEKEKRTEENAQSGSSTVDNTKNHEKNLETDSLLKPSTSSTEKTNEDCHKDKPKRKFSKNHFLLKPKNKKLEALKKCFEAKQKLQSQHCQQKKHMVNEDEKKNEEEMEANQEEEKLHDKEKRHKDKMKNKTSKETNNKKIEIKIHENGKRGKQEEKGKHPKETNTLKTTKNTENKQKEKMRDKGKLRKQEDKIRKKDENKTLKECSNTKNEIKAKHDEAKIHDTRKKGNQEEKRKSQDESKTTNTRKEITRNQDEEKTHNKEKRRKQEEKKDRQEETKTLKETKKTKNEINEKQDEEKINDKGKKRKQEVEIRKTKTLKETNDTKKEIKGNHGEEKIHNTRKKRKNEEKGQNQDESKTYSTNKEMKENQEDKEKRNKHGEKRNKHEEKKSSQETQTLKENNNAKTEMNKKPDKEKVHDKEKTRKQEEKIGNQETKILKETNNTFVDRNKDNIKARQQLEKARTIIKKHEEITNHNTRPFLVEASNLVKKYKHVEEIKPEDQSEEVENDNEVTDITESIMDPTGEEELNEDNPDHDCDNESIITENEYEVTKNVKSFCKNCHQKELITVIKKRPKSRIAEPLLPDHNYFEISRMTATDQEYTVDNSVTMTIANYEEIDIQEYAVNDIEEKDCVLESSFPEDTVKDMKETQDYLQESVYQEDTVNDVEETENYLRKSSHQEDIVSNLQDYLEQSSHLEHAVNHMEEDYLDESSQKEHAGNGIEENELFSKTNKNKTLEDYEDLIDKAKVMRHYKKRLIHDHELEKPNPTEEHSCFPACSSHSLEDKRDEELVDRVRKSWKRKTSRKHFRHQNIEVFKPGNDPSPCLLKKIEHCQNGKKSESIPKEAITESIVNTLGGQTKPETMKRSVSFNDKPKSWEETTYGRHILPAVVPEIPSTRRKSNENITLSKTTLKNKEKPSPETNQQFKSDDNARRKSTDMPSLTEDDSAIKKPRKSILKRRKTIGHVEEVVTTEKTNEITEQFQMLLKPAKLNLKDTSRAENGPVDLRKKNSEMQTPTNSLFTKNNRIIGIPHPTTQAFQRNTSHAPHLFTEAILQNRNHHPPVPPLKRQQIHRNVLPHEVPQRYAQPQAPYYQDIRNHMERLIHQTSQNYASAATAPKHSYPDDNLMNFFLLTLESLLQKPFSMENISKISEIYREINVFLGGNGLSDKTRQLASKILNDTSNYLFRSLQQKDIPPVSMASHIPFPNGENQLIQAQKQFFGQNIQPSAMVNIPHSQRMPFGGHTDPPLKNAQMERPEPVRMNIYEQVYLNQVNQNFRPNAHPELLRRNGISNQIPMSNYPIENLQYVPPRPYGVPKIGKKPSQDRNNLRHFKRDHPEPQNRGLHITVQKIPDELQIIPHPRPVNLVPILPENIRTTQNTNNTSVLPETSVIVKDNSMQITREPRNATKEKPPEKQNTQSEMILEKVHSCRNDKNQPPTVKEITGKRDVVRQEADRDKNTTKDGESRTKSDIEESISRIKSRILSSENEAEKHDLINIVISELAFIKKEEVQFLPKFENDFEIIEIEDDNENEMTSSPVQQKCKNLKRKSEEIALEESSEKTQNCKQDEEDIIFIERTKGTTEKDEIDLNKNTLSTKNRNKSTENNAKKSETIPKEDRRKTSAPKKNENNLQNETDKPPKLIPIRKSNHQKNSLLYSPETEPVSPVSRGKTFIFPENPNVTLPKVRVVNYEELQSSNIRKSTPPSTFSPKIISPTIRQSTFQDNFPANVRLLTPPETYCAEIHASKTFFPENAPQNVRRSTPPEGFSPKTVSPNLRHPNFPQMVTSPTIRIITPPHNGSPITLTPPIGARVQYFNPASRPLSQNGFSDNSLEDDHFAFEMPEDAPESPPKGKLCYVRESNTFVRYFDDTQVELFLKNLNLSDEALKQMGMDPDKLKDNRPSSNVSSSGRSEVIQIPKNVCFSCEESITDPEDYVKEIQLVETNVPRDFALFYRFVTRYQIVRDNNPISFQTFLTMFNTNRLKQLLVKYMSIMNLNKTNVQTVHFN